MADLFYNKTVTIWNKYTANNLRKDETWQPTVIENVWYQISRGNNIMNSGNSAADSVRLHISDSLSEPKRTYISAQQWKTLGETQRKKYYTLDSDNNSFFTCGDSSKYNTDDITNLFEHMKLNLPNVFRITSVDRFDSLIPHYEIWGK